MVEALKQWERKNPDWQQLPAIVPFLFYNGSAEWKIPDEFLALVDAEEGWRPPMAQRNNGDRSLY